MLLCNISNAIFQGKIDIRRVPLISDTEAVEWLKEHDGVNNDAALRRCTYDDWRICLPATIADENGVIPKTPKVFMLNDPNWFGLDQLNEKLIKYVKEEE